MFMRGVEMARAKKTRCEFCPEIARWCVETDWYEGLKYVCKKHAKNKNKKDASKLLWNKYPDVKPEHDMCVYVTNNKYGSACWQALYDKTYDIFTQYDPNLRDHPPLQVTHWVELPVSPDKE